MGLRSGGRRWDGGAVRQGRRGQARGAAEVAEDLEAVGGEGHAQLVPEVVEVLDQAPVDGAAAACIPVRRKGAMGSGSVLRFTCRRWGGGAAVHIRGIKVPSPTPFSPNTQSICIARFWNGIN
jgi:hypothetical protein